MRGTLVLALVAAAAVAAGGCHGCREDHPYVPYTIESGEGEAKVAPVEASVIDSGKSAPDAAAFSGEPAVMAPPGLTHWDLEGASLDAPASYAFVSAIAGDFDGDGAKDAFAIARQGDGNDPGILLYYRGGGHAPPATFAPPPGLARDASCAPVERLVLAGTRSVLAEIGASCAEHPSAAPARWVAVVSADATPKVLVATTLSDPAGAPTLTVDAEVSDRDGDGRDDVALRVTIEGGGPPLEPGPRVSAVLAWLDRPAGLSRDGSATEASFGSLAASASAKALRIADAAAVPGFVAQARALWRAACADGGAPRVVAAAGSAPMQCGAGRALEDLGLAEVRAYVTMGDALRAALALDRAQRPPAANTAARRKEAEKWIMHVAPIAKATTLRGIAAVPAAPTGKAPSWGSLAFEASGKLLVRTRAGIVRVDPDQGDEGAAPDMPDWKEAVTSPDGAMRWIETYDPCDGLPLRAAFEPASGDDLKEVAVPVVAAIGGRCVGSRGAPARAVPVAWGAGGLEALIEGELVFVAGDLARASALATFQDQKVTLGAPRSPSGRTYVVATGLGLVVRGPGGKSKLYRAPELEGTYTDQRGCAVSEDGTHVACARAGKGWVGLWGARDGG
jgi:hypothetical protein